VQLTISHWPVSNVRNPSVFQKFIRMCAARTGQLINFSGLANDCGITHNTAREWLSVLEASYIVFFLHPYHRNMKKRLVKTPKLYFYDPGLAAWLLRIRDHAQLSTHSMRGALFETWVVSEFIKGRYNRGVAADFHFWRDRTGNEIDLLFEEGEKLVPIEIKSGQTIARDSFSALQKWAEDVGRLAGQPGLVYAGKAAEVRSGVRVIPWQDVPEFARSC
jgi:predicted AAA+ superfamily ATPase